MGWDREGSGVVTWDGTDRVAELLCGMGPRGERYVAIEWSCYVRWDQEGSGAVTWDGTERVVELLPVHSRPLGNE